MANTLEKSNLSCADQCARAFNNGIQANAGQSACSSCNQNQPEVLRVKQ